MAAQTTKDVSLIASAYFEKFADAPWYAPLIAIAIPASVTCFIAYLRYLNKKQVAQSTDRKNILDFKVKMALAQKAKNTVVQDKGAQNAN